MILVCAHGQNHDARLGLWLCLLVSCLFSSWKNLFVTSLPNMVKSLALRNIWMVPWQPLLLKVDGLMERLSNAFLIGVIGGDIECTDAIFSIKLVKEWVLNKKKSNFLLFVINVNHWFQIFFLTQDFLKLVHMQWRLSKVIFALTVCLSVCVSMCVSGIES